MSDLNNTELDSLSKELVKSNPNIFKGVPENKRRELVKTFAISFKQTVTTHHKGPLPSPETLGKYNDIIPNGAERIMIMAESQHAHRINLETIAVTEQLSQSKRGQFFGLTIGLFAIICSASCILMGHDWGGGILGVGGVTSLVSVFVIGKNRQAKSLVDKAPQENKS